SWGSIEGRDRFQNELTDDFHIKDARLQYQLDLGYWISGTQIGLFSTYESIQRKGNIKTINHKETETRLFFGFKFKF
ncbi:unnamed protein product, partial [marine sediment metagenome]